MIRYLKYRGISLGISIIILLLSLTAKSLIAQSSDIDYSMSIYSDRSFYVVGETVEIKVIIPKLLYSEKLVRSFIYCDLVGQDGQVQSSIKLMLLNGKADGHLEIPSSIKSGYYIIRAYTRGMRLTPNKYSFISIKVVNVENKALLSLSDNSILKLNIDSIENNKGITISGLDKSLSKRAKADINIEIDTSSIISQSLSISIVPKSTFSQNNLSAELINDNNIVDSLAYPERKGFSLSGTVVQKDTSIGIMRKRIFVSIVGTKDVFTTMSDTLGKFYVSLPFIYGEHEVYISTDTIDKNAIILIDKDYDFKSNYWLNKYFILNASEKKMALMLAQNIAVYKLFDNNSHSKESIVASNPFYGKADETTVIMDYIDLPSLHMYFTEIPSSVHLYKHHKKYKARIWGSNETPLFLNPLIMVDYVAVNDLDRVLKLNPKSINRIEVINTYYQKGDMSFGGIVNFISNNNDFGGLEFKNSSLVINYSFLSSYKPIEPTKDENAPDARTTLYLNPMPKVVDGKISINFSTSDVEGDYEVIVQALNKDGNKVVCKSGFLVVR